MFVKPLAASPLSAKHNKLKKSVFQHFFFFNLPGLFYIQNANSSLLFSSSFDSLSLLLVFSTLSRKLPAGPASLSWPAPPVHCLARSWKGCRPSLASSTWRSGSRPAYPPICSVRLCPVQFKISSVSTSPSVVLSLLTRGPALTTIRSPTVTCSAVQ